MTFDYLRDAPPEVFDRAKSLCADANLRGIAGFLAASAFAIAMSWMLEAVHLHEARTMVQRAQEQLDRSTVAAVRVNAEIRSLHVLLALDKRLRDIKLSPVRTANELADLAQRVPARTWLVTLSSTSSGFELSGRAVGLGPVGKALAALRGDLVAARASGGRDRRIIDFQMQVGPE
jgi:hypothetical protein